MQTLLSRSSASIIKASGHLNATNTTFQQALMSALSSRPAVLVVDLSEVDSLDSAGLMIFISALTLSQQVNTRLQLLSVPPAIRIIFELTQLDRAFDIVEQYPELDQVTA